MREKSVFHDGCGMITMVKDSWPYAPPPPPPSGKPLTNRQKVALALTFVGVILAVVLVLFLLRLL